MGGHDQPVVSTRGFKGRNDAVTLAVAERDSGAGSGQPRNCLPGGAACARDEDGLAGEDRAGRLVVVEPLSAGHGRSTPS